MEPFNVKNRCPKCGGTAKAEYHCDKDPRCDGDLNESEHLHRTCGQCGYDWLEKPLDVEEG